MLSPIFLPSDKPQRSGWYACFESLEDAEIAHEETKWLWDSAYIHWWDNVSQLWWMTDLMILEIANQKQYWFGRVLFEGEDFK